MQPRINLVLLPRRARAACRVASSLLDHDGYLPSVVVITDGKRPDVRVARTLRFDPGTIVVMDRGYVDYAWFGQLTSQEVFFVTRLKRHTAYQVVERRPVPARSTGLRDELIELTTWDAASKCPFRLRLVEIDDPDKQGTLTFLTNQLAFGATTLAAIYKDRWQVELFFKALKQNLKIKPLWGTSADALKGHVWTALIAVLLLKYLQLRSRFRPCSSPRRPSWPLRNRDSRRREPHGGSPPGSVQKPRKARVQGADPG